MVNEPATTAKADRRERPRDNVGPSPALGVANLNPFGDLHPMQHLSARLARSLRGVFEPLLRAETRVWTDPLLVQRFSDYRPARHDGLPACVPLKLTPGPGRARAVLAARFSLQLLSRSFGVPGVAPAAPPHTF